MKIKLVERDPIEQIEPAKETQLPLATIKREFYTTDKIEFDLDGKKITVKTRMASTIRFFEEMIDEYHARGIDVYLHKLYECEYNNGDKKLYFLRFGLNKP